MVGIGIRWNLLGQVGVPPGVGAAKSTAKKIMGGEELIQGSTGSAHISAGSRSESQPVVRFEAQI